MVKSIPNNLKYYILGICNLLLVSNISAQIDFTPGLNYVYHQGTKNQDAVGTSNNYSHQFHASFGFRKHWKSNLVPFFNPYFGYVDIQQYFPSVSNLESNSTFTELSSIKQRGAFIGAGFDFKVSDKCYLVAQPEFMLLSSGDQAKTESYSSSLGTSAVRTKISYRADEIGLKQELPLYRFVINSGIKFSFHRIDISLMYRLMLAKSYGYEKKVWYSVTDLNNGNVTNGSSTFQYKTRLNGFGISLRYIFLDWNY
jgi:hypothetical protein